MSVLIIGANGSMGKRYQTILKTMGRTFSCIDKDDPIPESHFDGISLPRRLKHTSSILKSLLNTGNRSSSKSLFLKTSPRSKKRSHFVRNIRHPLK